MSATRRPWVVHVRDVGPTYTFAHEARARALAARLVGPEFVHGRHLVGNYGEVVVYENGVMALDDWARTVYRPEGATVERWERGKGWTPE